jgi:AcrR family transcriptional regulator
MARHRKGRKGTRERLLIAAADAFSEHGYRGTTVRMVCGFARANVAAVSYHFGSKEKLYIETFRYVFQDSPIEMLTKVPLQVENEEQWRQELFKWTRLVIAVLTGDEPWQKWQCSLFARERTDPSEVLPIFLQQYYLPLQNRLEELLKMALPEDASLTDVVIWRVSTIAQCVVYAHRRPPWDQQMFPNGKPSETWLDQVAEHIVGGVTQRLVFRLPLEGAGLSPEHC